MGDSLQFDRAEYSSPAQSGVVCTQCRQPVVQSYYAVGGRVICSRCREERERIATSSGFTRLLRAFGAGLGVAVAGSAVYYGIRAATGYEFALIAIAVGWGVGRAVQWGSGERGGWPYQIMAILLTYASIACNYVPDFWKLAPKANIVLMVLLSLMVPFVMGVQNIVGLLILFFGLFEAWKMTKRRNEEVTGPFSVAPTVANG